MAKRFTDTDKWKKPFIRTLKPEYKLFWLYLLDDCDMAGIWQVDIEVAELKLGVKLSLEKAIGLFEGKVVSIDNGTKWFIPDFIDFQYGQLNDKQKAHLAVLRILQKRNLIGYLYGINTVQDKDKAKDQVKDKDTGVVCYNVQELVLGNQIEFESICMEAGKSADVVKSSLENYHLWMQEKENYPKSKQSLFSGFRRWLKNDRTESVKKIKRGQFSDSKW